MDSGKIDLRSPPKERCFKNNICFYNNTRLKTNLECAQTFIKCKENQSKKIVELIRNGDERVIEQYPVANNMPVISRDNFSRDGRQFYNGQIFVIQRISEKNAIVSDIRFDIKDFTKLFTLSSLSLVVPLAVLNIL